MVEEQADGAYPRLNAAMVQSGAYESQIVSLVGKFQGHQSFLCCDNGVLPLSTEHVDASLMHQMDKSDMVFEVVGQIAAMNVVTVFVIRELSQDTDLDVYNQMISIQHNPKFASYFKSAPSSTSMATN